MKKILLPVFALSMVMMACGDDAPVETPDTSANDTTTAVQNTSVLTDDFTLGDASYIAVSTNNLQESLEFYKKLGLNVVHEEAVPYPWAYVTDSTVMVGIFQDSMGYQGLSYYTDDYDTKVAGLKEAGAIFDMENEVDGLKMCVFTNPEGLMPIAIIGMPPGDMYQPKGPNMQDVLMGENAMNFAAWPNPKMGVFGEYAFTTKDLAAEAEFWSKLGFDSMGGSDYPGYEYRIMGDGQQIIGLHKEIEGKAFNSLTFFAPDTKERMAALRREGINEEPTEDPMMSDTNFIIKSPEDKQIFLFHMPEEAIIQMQQSMSGS